MGSDWPKEEGQKEAGQVVEYKEMASRAYTDLDWTVKQSCRLDKKDWL